MRQIWLAAMSVALLGGCSTILEGRTQEITITTTPSGASCTLNREGAPIGTVRATPGSVTVDKNKYDIEVVCDLDGYERMTYLDESGTAAAVFGNILIGGAAGVDADTANGSRYKYDSSVTIALIPRTNTPLTESRPALASTPVPIIPPPPAMVVASTPLPPVSAPAAVMPGPVSAGPAGSAASAASVPVDLRRAENAAERYRVLSRLVADGLVPPERYGAWAQQNVGAFLLTTAPPAFVSAGGKAPSYEQLAEFLRSVQAEKNRAVAEAERKALFGTLMPTEGLRAQPLKPPVDGDGIRTWYAFLDRLRDEGLVSADSIEAEKSAINDARIAAGLSPVPVYSASAGVIVQ